MSNNLISLNLTTTNGTVHDVEAIFSDLIKYDIIRSRKNYPSKEESEFLFMGLIAFCALQREGKIEGIKVEEFLEQIATVEAQEDDESEEAEAEFPVF